MSDFIAYQYDENGFYLGEVECQRDPKRNKPLLPRNCTFTKPPEDNGYKWDGTDWVESKTIEVKDSKLDWEQNIINSSIEVLKQNPTKEEIKAVIVKLMEIL